MSKRKSSAKDSAIKSPTAQDSLIVTPYNIIKRTSVITTAYEKGITDSEEHEVTENDNEVRIPPGQPSRDEELFRQTFSRGYSDSKYTIRKRLTAGGMGEVYLALDKDFQRHTAMKVILPELRGNFHIIESFIKEARITSQLEHSNIIPVHDLGYLPNHGIFFTMKLMKGKPLNEILHEMEMKNPKYVKKYDMYMLLGIIRKICDAVAFAHSQQVIHRDIKPHNIMVGEFGEVLLMDWGLAKKITTSSSPDSGKISAANIPAADSSLHDEDWIATELGVVKGSPAYMSPEQAMGNVAEMDYQSDIFLLGATLYHIFTFYPPYLGDDILEVVQMARNYELMPLETYTTDQVKIPNDLGRIIMKALSRDKTDRYNNINEMIEDIDDFLKGEMNFCHRFYEKGSVLMREGESGSESFLIVKGKLQVDKQHAGKLIPISTLRKGDIVGEMSLITSERRSATVTALEDTEVLVLTQELFTQHLTKLPPWLGKTIYLLAERLKAANDKL